MKLSEYFGQDDQKTPMVPGTTLYKGTAPRTVVYSTAHGYALVDERGMITTKFIKPLGTPQVTLGDFNRMYDTFQYTLKDTCDMRKIRLGHGDIIKLADGKLAIIVNSRRFEYELLALSNLNPLAKLTASDSGGLTAANMKVLVDLSETEYIGTYEDVIKKLEA